MTTNLLKPDKPRHQPKEGSKEAGLREMRQRVIDEEIPAFCQAKNRKPLSAEKQKKLDAALAKAPAGSVTTRDWRIPKGMSDEEGKAYIENLAAEKKRKTDERIAKLRESKGLPPLPAASAETVTAAAVEPKESEVRTNLKTKPAAKTKTRSTERRKRSATTRKPNGGHNKSDIVEQMLLSKNGATRAELSKASGWPNVNLKTAAERAKKKLVENDGHFRLIAK